MCVFCKIVAGEIPSYKLYEDDDVLAFLDIAQVTTGHVLVIPKKHYKDIFALDKDIAQKLFAATVEMAQKLQKNLKINDLNLVNNNGKKAGQEVDHYHLHLLPRYLDDDVEFKFKRQNLSQDEMKKIQEKILDS